MSTYWRLHCAEHDATQDQGLNHGQGRLRELAAMGAGIAALHRSAGWEVDINTWDSVGAGAIGGIVDALRFLRQHGDCELDLLSEYGDIEAIGARCGIPHGLLPVVCGRGAGHTWGKHAAGWSVMENMPPGARGILVLHTSRVEWDRPVPAEKVLAIAKVLHAELTLPDLEARVRVPGDDHNEMG